MKKFERERMTKFDEEYYKFEMAERAKEIRAWKYFSLVLAVLVLVFFVWLAWITTDFENAARNLGVGFAKQECNERHEVLSNLIIENDLPTIICTNSTNKIDGVSYNIR